MTPEPASYPGYRFPAEVIRHAVWLYHVFSLSLRDVELILAERGVVCTAPGSLDKWLAYAARLKVCSCQAARAASGLRWPFFSISHAAL
jgi:transposase-like protein